jgi:hypothetical protein
MGVAQEGQGGGLIFGALSLFSHPNFWTFPHRKMGTTSFFLKGFSTHGELKNSLEHEVYIHFVIHKCLVAGRCYGPNIERNFPLIT